MNDPLPTSPILENGGGEDSHPMLENGSEEDSLPIFSSGKNGEGWGGVFRQFAIDGQMVEAAPFGSGHINDTYLAVYDQPGGQTRAIFQRINTQVFTHPVQVMENAARVTQHSRGKVIARGGDPLREVMTLIPTREGDLLTKDDQGNVWRAWRYVEGSIAYDTPPNLDAVRETGRAFGEFQRMLADLPGARLHETILGFHNTPKRLADFLRAVETDPAGRASEVKREIEFLLDHQSMAGVITEKLATGELPERVTHNDTKINNVLFDAATGQALCVIDLDTVMPGSALYDFGDMARAGAAKSAEDEPGPSKAGFDLELYAQLAHGYLAAAGSMLTSAELELLPFSARLITYEQALRFLGDYLNGDIYYKVRRPDQNQDRARTQIKMLEEMIEQVREMKKIIDQNK